MQTKSISFWALFHDKIFPGHVPTYSEIPEIYRYSRLVVT